MKDGQTLWAELCYHYDKGVRQVREFQKTWDQVQRYVDSERFSQVQIKLREQCMNAQVWKDACLLYFRQFSKMPFPNDMERPVNNLEDLIKKDEQSRK
jgi:alpha-glucuronidase